MGDDICTHPLLSRYFSQANAKVNELDIHPEAGSGLISSDVETYS